jgi:hypothetical protein
VLRLPFKPLQQRNHPHASSCSAWAAGQPAQAPMAVLLVFFLLLLQLGPSSCGNVTAPLRFTDPWSCSCSCLIRLRFLASICRCTLCTWGRGAPSCTRRWPATRTTACSPPFLAGEATVEMLAHVSLALIGITVIQFACPCSEHAAKDAILYSYRHGFSGFAAVLTDRQAERLAGTSHFSDLAFCSGRALCSLF